MRIILSNFRYYLLPGLDFEKSTLRALTLPPPLLTNDHSQRSNLRAVNRVCPSVAAAKSQCLQEAFKRRRAGAIECARGATRHAMSRLFAVSGWLARFARRNSLRCSPWNRRRTAAPHLDGRDVTWVLRRSTGSPVSSRKFSSFIFLSFLF